MRDDFEARCPSGKCVSFRIWSSQVRKQYSRRHLIGVIEKNGNLNFNFQGTSYLVQLRLKHVLSLFRLYQTTFVGVYYQTCLLECSEAASWEMSKLYFQPCPIMTVVCCSLIPFSWSSIYCRTSRAASTQSFTASCHTTSVVRPPVCGVASASDVAANSVTNVVSVQSPAACSVPPETDAAVRRPTSGSS